MLNFIWCKGRIIRISYNESTSWCKLFCNTLTINRFKNPSAHLSKSKTRQMCTLFRKVLIIKTLFCATAPRDQFVYITLQFDGNHLPTNTNKETLCLFTMHFHFLYFLQKIQKFLILAIPAGSDGDYF